MPAMPEASMDGMGDAKILVCEEPLLQAPRFEHCKTELFVLLLAKVHHLCLHRLPSSRYHSWLCEAQAGDVQNINPRILRLCTSRAAVLDDMHGTLKSNAGGINLHPLTPLMFGHD